MSTYLLPAGEMCPLSSERREACIYASGHGGRCSWARCHRAPVGWECTREAGHHGPCAAREVCCGAAWDFHVDAHSLSTRHVVCTKPIGHDGEHRGEIGWPS